MDRSPSNTRALLAQTCAAASDFLETVTDRPVGRPADFHALLASMGGPLPADGEDPFRVIENLRQAADPGLVATAGLRSAAAAQRDLCQHPQQG